MHPCNNSALLTECCWLSKTVHQSDSIDCSIDLLSQEAVSSCNVVTAMPLFGIMFLFFSMANLCLPGTSSFIGELHGQHMLWHELHSRLEGLLQQGDR